MLQTLLYRMSGELNRTIEINRAHLMDGRFSQGFILHRHNKLISATTQLRASRLDNQNFALVIFGSRRSFNLRRFPDYIRLMPEGGFTRKAYWIGRAVKTTRIMLERRRTLATGSQCLGVDNSLTTTREKLVRQRDFYSATILGVVDGGTRCWHPLLPE